MEADSLDSSNPACPSCGPVTVVEAFMFGPSGKLSV
jgi:hypothetical protein